MTSSTEDCISLGSKIHTCNVYDLPRHPSLSEATTQDCDLDKQPDLNTAFLLEYKEELLKHTTPETYYLSLVARANA